MEDIDVNSLSLEAWKNGRLVEKNVKEYSFRMAVGYTNKNNPTSFVKIVLNPEGKSFASFFPKYE